MIISPEIHTILKVVQTYLEIDVIYANQDYERPRGDYVALYLIDEKPIGFSQNSLSDDGKVLTLKKMFELQICFDCVGKNPYSFASLLTTMWELPSIHDALVSHGIAWHKSSPLRNTTILMDEKYQQRLTLECSFYIDKTLTEKINFIEKVKINGINQ